MIPFHLQPIVEAMVAELSNQLERPDFHRMDSADPENFLIEGRVDLVALARAVAFCPTGDNHHNAAACPHCSPK